MHIPFDHTYILYDPTDIISTVSVQFSLLPIYIMVFYTSWFLLTREIQPVIVVGGHLVGEVMNKIIKRAVRQPRPDFHKDFGSGSLSLSYGMPSAHSQFMGFFAAYFVCIVVMRVRPPYKRFTCSVLVLSALLVASSRVYLQYHTIPQVIVGLLVGSLSGLVYFGATEVARDSGLVDWVLDWRIVRWWYVKDSYYHSYTTFEGEYRQYRERIQAKWTEKKENEPIEQAEKKDGKP